MFQQTTVHQNQTDIIDRLGIIYSCNRCYEHFGREGSVYHVTDTVTKDIGITGLFRGRINKQGL